MTSFWRTPRRLCLLPLGSTLRTRPAPVALQAEESRGLNFYAVASLAVLATSMLPGLWTARSWVSGVDDLVLAAIAGAAFGWYLVGRNRIRRSFVPLVLLTLGLVTKLVAAWLAYNWDVADSGDATAAAFLALTIGVTTWRLFARRPAASRATGDITREDLLFQALRERCGFQRPPKA